jgi:capsular polysaccharide export protein
LINNGFSQFNGKKVLLLQGPIGPFFQRLSLDLRDVGATVYKINFNGGDWLFYRKNVFNYNKHLSLWPAFFEEFIQKYQIDVVLLFGDCRSIHQEAHEIASKHHLEIGVFEEGYVRPDYITFEKYGVNANSQISKSPEYYADLPDITKKHAFSIGKPFWYAAMWGMMYNTAADISSPFFRHYQHHRPLSIWQGLFWIRSLWRKWLFAYQQRSVLKNLIKKHHKNYYLVALQVHNDAQIHNHSEYFSIEAFISEVINSFAMNAPEDTRLVIKHHPMDRGFVHYGKLINVVCQNQSLRNRIHYVHDLHLPTLLNHTKGVVVINSTVGLSALDLLCPVVTCGNAIYDIEGLTYQGNLNSFWHESATFEIDQKLHYKFLNHLIHNSQVNGNFYKRLKYTQYYSGICFID